MLLTSDFNAESFHCLPMFDTSLLAIVGADATAKQEPPAAVTSKKPGSRFVLLRSFSSLELR